MKKTEKEYIAFFHIHQKTKRRVRMSEIERTTASTRGKNCVQLKIHYFWGSFGVFVGELKYGKSMNKFKEFAMITA